MSRKFLLLALAFCLLCLAPETAVAKSLQGQSRKAKWPNLTGPSMYLKGKKILPLDPYTKEKPPYPHIPRAKPHPLKRYEPPVKPIGGRDEYRAGMAAIERLDYRMAIKLFKAAVANYRGNYVDLAKSRLLQIEALAGDEMARYEELWAQGRREEAIGVLAEVADNFDGSETATTAKRRLLELVQTPGLAETVRNARAEAALSFRERMRRRLLRRAEPGMSELEAVPAEEEMLEVGEPTVEERCLRLLSLAANYRLNRHLEAARAAYREIIDLYPGSDSARTAEEELRAVEGEMNQAKH